MDRRVDRRRRALRRRRQIGPRVQDDQDAEHGHRGERVEQQLEPDVVWAETGRWKAIEADLTLGFAPRPGGCSVAVSFGVRGRGLLRPVGWAATGAGLFAVRSDLRKAARILAERER